MNYITDYHSLLGRLILESDGEHLTKLWLREEDYRKAVKEEKRIKSDEDLEIFKHTKNWLDCYFAGEKPEISRLSLKPEGTPFQMEVWKLLCEIPYGKTTTYGEMAKKVAVKMGKARMSARAVGGAVGRNPIAIIIPCHRVIGADGSMTGFSGGIENKIWLLDHERKNTDKNCKTS